MKGKIKRLIVSFTSAVVIMVVCMILISVAAKEWVPDKTLSVYEYSMLTK